MSSQAAPRLLILGWSHVAEELTFLKHNDALKQIAPVIISPNLSAVLRTALGRAQAVVVLRPGSQEDHEQVEEFLLKIDRQNKINSHYVIVVSSQGKRFKSGVQSHSVINTFDENAITRAVLHGIMINTKEDQGEMPALAESEESGQRESGPLPKPSLLEYFKLPAFKKTSPVLSTLSNDDRERIIVTLNEMNHAKLPLPDTADPLERAAVFVREYHASEIVIVSSSEVLAFGPTRTRPIDRKLLPGPGEGVLGNDHALFSFLGVPANMRLRYTWVPELECCILTWALENEAAIFAQALIYSVLRIRKSDKFKVRQAA